MLAAVAVTLGFVVPGLGYVLAGWRVAGGWLVVTAPAVSVFLVSWTGWLLGRVGITPAPVLLFAVATGLGVLAGTGLRLLATRGQGPAGRRAAVPGGRTRPAEVLAALAGVLVGCAATARLWLTSPDWADQVPTYWDATWHGYLVSLVQRTGLVDAAHLVPPDPQLPSWTDYYPAGWHIVVGSALGAVDGPTLAGYNYGQVLFAALVLPAGTVALARVLGVRSPVVLALAPVLVAVAYPVTGHLVDTTAFQAALALAPGALAAVLLAARHRWRLPYLLAAAVVTGGVFMTQPSVVVVIGLLTCCYLAGGAVRARHRSRRPQLLGFLRWVAASAILVLPWVVLAASHATATLTYARKMDAGYPKALHELLVQYEGMAAAPTLVAALAVAVATLLVARRGRWLVVATVLFGGLYLVARAETGPVRQLLTGFWYTDWYRLGGVFWLLAVLVMVLAAEVLVRVVTRADGSVAVRLGSTLALVALTASLLAALPAWWSAIGEKMTALRAEPTVTASDRAAFSFLRGRVGAGERVLNDWPDGSGWLYALEGVDPLSVWMNSDHDADRAYLIEHFADLNTDPRVTALLRTYSIRYVYTDQTRDVAAPYRLTLPEDWSRLRPVFERGDVKVFEILPEPVAGGMGDSAS
ncbi:MAG TPA: DUF6541 family protein [Candidatus Nanopelagicales bacterium]|nr:DUF6541 family protein [Candidatus Nanopelagicales bacterium]